GAHARCFTSGEDTPTPLTSTRPTDSQPLGKHVFSTGETDDMATANDQAGYRANDQADFKVSDLKLADKGRLRIEWAESRMPVLMALRARYQDEKPFAG